ncbi:MAG: calcium/sodium antiporter [Candidatus Thalassarchaeum sp.]|nr:calcium/sodium antiporter [Candidatus Thalassarchaeum sp.]MEC8938186.1 calcium/sodium antiporter [Candidatus Thermoplasmatota archaeon]MEC9351564.1 calcium/sodium antiporter [Candidatus Thermoplasmatota archaeon]MEC9393461.1 calcium/sodium antiporter [Candidatus Thermoplasmatota archaeon]MEC9477573.1 calcium/sodium antiporter [Candidatus Thermoplasmatota archaeon]
MLIPDPILVLVGFVLLMAGGEGVVQGAIQIAYRLRVPPLLVGFTIVAIGTSLPELAVAIEAISQNEPDIAVGGVLGSNVANVMLVLGTACMLGSGDDAGVGIRRDAVAVILATVLLTAFVYFGEIPPEGGVFMLILLVSYYTYAYLTSRGKADAEEPEDTWLPDNILLAIISTIAGGVMIWQGAILLLEGATGLADTYGIDEAIVGLSLVALGTSLPELAVTLIAALRNQGGVAVGNVLGSNVMNILGILGTASVIGGGIEIAGEFAGRDIWVVILTSGLAAAMLLDDREIGPRVGATMVIGYLAYMAFLYLG